MVGDFQQSIYRDRADLSKYRRIHETLVETGAAETLQFSVTFRLDTAQLDFVNETFREILNDRDQQVAFVELQSAAESFARTSGAPQLAARELATRSQGESV